MLVEVLVEMLAGTPVAMFAGAVADRLVVRTFGMLVVREVSSPAVLEHSCKLEVQRILPPW